MNASGSRHADPRGRQEGEGTRMKRMTRKELIERLVWKSACSPALRWVRRQRGSPQSLVLRAKGEWCVWLAEMSLDRKYTDAVDRLFWRVRADSDYATAERVEDEYARAVLLDNWPRVEAWLRGTKNA